MKSLSFVIIDGGDGSNGVHWVRDEAVIDKMLDLAEEGDERYASGDGLQLKKLRFPDDFDLDAFIAANNITLKTLADFK